MATEIIQQEEYALKINFTVLFFVRPQTNGEWPSPSLSSHLPPPVSSPMAGRHTASTPVLPVRRSLSPRRGVREEAEAEVEDGLNSSTVFSQHRALEAPLTH